MKIQPQLFAKTGASGVSTATHTHHVDTGTPPLRVPHRVIAAKSMVRKPRPIMNRNDQ